MRRNARSFSLITLFLLSGLAGIAQINRNSIYSRFGIGDIVFSGFGPSRAMGGTAIGLRQKNTINFLNPASYTSQDTLSFILDGALVMSYAQNKTTALKTEMVGGNLGHLAIGFPVTRWWKSSFGLLPFSTVGYNITEYSNYKISLSPIAIRYVDYYYSGSGGTNQLYFGNAVMPFKNLSVGVNVAYLFGTIIHESYSDLSSMYQDATTQQFFSQADFLNTTTVKGIYANYGIQYTNTIAGKFAFTLGGTYQPSTKVHARYDNFILNTLSVGGSSITDTIENSMNNKSSIKLPQNVGIGASFGTKKILVALDYTMEDWSKVTFLGKSDSLSISKQFRGGIDFVPDLNSISSYWARVHYRIGGHYSQTYLKLNGEQINDYGLSCGVSLPFKNLGTTFHISFEVGQRGTTAKNLVMERYAMLYFNFALNDVWFVKRKFD